MINIKDIDYCVHTWNLLKRVTRKTMYKNCLSVTHMEGGKRKCIKKSVKDPL